MVLPRIESPPAGCWVLFIVILQKVAGSQTDVLQLPWGLMPTGVEAREQLWAVGIFGFEGGGW